MISSFFKVNLASKYSWYGDKQSLEEKQRLQAIVTLFLDRHTSNNNDLLGAIMNKISDQAQARGLTPEILESILNE